jgi:tRNA threonylcarbamoyladenosine biosynthesis protein TsaE
MEMTYDLSQLDQVAEKLLSQFGSIPIWAFYAPMGAGKTTLIARICKQMGITDAVASPTFAIMNEYEAKGKMVYHMDWYRLEDEAEARRTGVEAAMEEADQCFIEWPEKAPALLPEGSLHLKIEILDLPKYKPMLRAGMSLEVSIPLN